MAANATAVWRVRPSGSNNNGGGYDPGIASAGIDYSQQNSPQVSQSSTANTSTATVTLTDTGASFTSALIGNGIRVSGTSISTTYTFITAVPTSTTLTLQTSPGTAGTAVSYNIGGGWADYWTNTTGAPVVAGNTIYILGSGVPNPSSYTYDYTRTGYFTPVSGDQASGGLVSFIGDPSTPSNGVPCLKVDGLTFYSGGGWLFKNLWFVASAANNNAYGIFGGNSNVPLVVINCVFDQFGYDIALSGGSSSNPPIQAIGIEVFSSVGKHSTNASYGMNLSPGSGPGAFMINSNIHDCIGPGVIMGRNSVLSNCIIAKNGAAGVVITLTAGYTAECVGCTIDANSGNGIEFTTQASLSAAVCLNNIISNHVTGGTYGMTVDAGTAAQNSRVQGFVNYNTFYNNTTNYNAINAGANDTAEGSNPYVGQSTENYTLA